MSPLQKNLTCKLIEHWLTFKHGSALIGFGGWQHFCCALFHFDINCGNNNKCDKSNMMDMNLQQIKTSKSWCHVILNIIRWNIQMSLDNRRRPHYLTLHILVLPLILIDRSITFIEYWIYCNIWANMYFIFLFG